MINLGYMNGWTSDPVQYLKCRSEKHPLEVEKIGKCINKYTCKICSITYKIDSGD